MSCIHNLPIISKNLKQTVIAILFRATLSINCLPTWEPGRPSICCRSWRCWSRRQGPPRRLPSTRSQGNHLEICIIIIAPCYCLFEQNGQRKWDTLYMINHIKFIPKCIDPDGMSFIQRWERSTFVFVFSTWIYQSNKGNKRDRPMLLN